MRRISALIGIAIVVGLALALIWQVWLHHGRDKHQDEPPVVSLPLSEISA